MGLILAYFRKPRLDLARIRIVWCDHICEEDEYFQKVIHRLCKRNEAIRAAMLSSNAQHAESEAEEDFVLSSLADRISTFFHNLIEDDIIANEEELKRCCYDIGRQHAAYGKKRFKISFWEEFTLTMMNVLEEIYPTTTKEEQKAWHVFLRYVNENMLDGYHDALTYNDKPT
ncbi:unnamed protein product [Caenorhabditis angaria]|uniref:Globin domain-containing protein n=1 Tax=Caenorhabditis angaria TaxID=860376 RepID=A0A9P1MZL1_9PELO|nr:unnamed protein product [Caenorhabditis angaria]